MRDFISFGCNTGCGTELSAGTEPTACDCPVDPDVAGQVPGLMLSEISAPTYCELVVAKRFVGTTNIRVSPANCDRLCNHRVGFTIKRDLFDPKKYRDVKAIALVKRVVLANFDPFSRNFNTNEVTPISYLMPLRTRLSVLLIDKSFSPGELRHFFFHLMTHREILPSRMVR